MAKKKHLNAPTVVLLKLHSGVATNVMARLFAMRAVSSMLKKKIRKLQDAHDFFTHFSFKLHREHRPMSMKTDTIKKRQRIDNSNNTHATSKKPRKDFSSRTTKNKQPSPPAAPAALPSTSITSSQLQQAIPLYNDSSFLQFTHF